MTYAVALPVDPVSDALRISEARYRRLFETARDGILLLNAETAQIEDVNPYLIELLGYSHAEFLGKKLWEVGSFADCAQSKEMFAILQDKGYVRYDDLPLKTKGGSPVAVEFVSNSYDCEGVKVIQCNVRNISERKALEQARSEIAVALEQSEALATSVLDSLDSTIAVIEADGTIITVNKRWKEFGEENGALNPSRSAKGVNYLDVCRVASGQPDGLYARAAFDGIQTVLTGAEPEFSMEYPCSSPLEKRWFRTKVTPLQGSRPGAVISHENVTKLHQVSDAMQEAGDRQAAMINASIDAIIAVDDDERIVIFSTAAEELLRIPASEAIGLPFERFIPSRFRSRHHDHMKEYKASGVTTRSMGRATLLSALRSDGSEVPIEVAISQFSTNGRHLFMATIRNVTERNLALAKHNVLEEQLRESQKMQAIGTLAGGIAHDFNNILAAIQGNTALALEDSANNPRAIESLAEIQKATTRARDLVQQILSFSRRQPTTLANISLVAVVEESARLLRSTLPARLSLRMELAAQLPNVVADATQIEQVLLDLCTNAMQAMHDRAGHIDIHLDTVLLDQAYAAAHPQAQAMLAAKPGRAVRLAVRDNGPGMDAATRARVFEPFFTTKPVGEGTGLGLSVVHGIAQNHGGVIFLESGLGVGTIFTLLLPAAADNTAPDATPTTIQPLLRFEGGRHILYLDDDEAMLFLCARLFERRGHRVTTFTNQTDALAALRADPFAFDLFLTDYNMPGPSGVDVARAALAIRPGLPVAMASGFVDDALQKAAAEAGVIELIFKAADIDEFCDTVDRLAHKFRGQKTQATHENQGQVNHGVLPRTPN